MAIVELFQRMDSMTLATWVIAAATAANICVACVTAFIYRRMSRQISEQIELARHHMELTKAAFQIANRPYLTIRVANGRKGPNPNEFSADVHLISLGSAPARNVVASVEPLQEGVRWDDAKRLGPFLLQPHSDQEIAVRWVINPLILKPTSAMTLTVALAFEDVEAKAYALRAEYDWDYQQGVFVPTKLG
jgi:hypothetical protein